MSSPPKAPIKLFKSEFGSIKKKNSGLNPWSIQFWGYPRLGPRDKLPPPLKPAAGSASAPDHCLGANMNIISEFDAPCFIKCLQIVSLYVFLCALKFSFHMFSSTVDVRLAVPTSYPVVHRLALSCYHMTLPIPIDLITSYLDTET